MARPRFHRLEHDRRERVFAHAAEEFADRGYEAASVNRIIERAGMSKGSLYYYFEDKEDLFATVLEHAIEAVHGDAGLVPPAELTADTFWNHVRGLMLRSVAFLEHHGAYVRLVLSLYDLRDTYPTSETVRRIVDGVRAYTESVLARGQALGVVRTDLPLDMLVDVTQALDASGGRWRLAHWDEFSPDQRVAHADAHIDLVRDMLHAQHEGWEE